MERTHPSYSYLVKDIPHLLPKTMSIFDNFPSLEEIYEQYDDGSDDGGESDDYTLLPEEYEEQYRAQFSYDMTVNAYMDATIPTVAEPIDYDVSDYFYSKKLGIGVHNKTGLLVMFHSDQCKNYILSDRLFDSYALTIVFITPLMGDVIEAMRDREAIATKMQACELVEPGFGNGQTPY